MATISDAPAYGERLVYTLRVARVSDLHWQRDSQDGDRPGCPCHSVLGEVMCIMLAARACGGKGVCEDLLKKRICHYGDRDSHLAWSWHAMKSWIGFVSYTRLTC